jgi:hypothetical protein
MDSVVAGRQGTNGDRKADVGRGVAH